MQTLSLQQSQLMPPRNCNMLMLTKTTKTTAERSAWQQQTNRRRRKFCFALNISICMIIETISALQRLHTQTLSVTHMRTHTHRHKSAAYLLMTLISKTSGEKIITWMTTGILIHSRSTRHTLTHIFIHQAAAASARSLFHSPHERITHFCGDCLLLLLLCGR